MAKRAEATSLGQQGQPCLTRKRHFATQRTPENWALQALPQAFPPARASAQQECRWQVGRELFLQTQKLKASQSSFAERLYALQPLFPRTLRRETREKK